MCSLTRILIGLLAFVLTASLSAFEIPKKSLEERVRAADVVFVGKVRRIEQLREGEADGTSVAVVEVITFMKGDASGDVRFVFHTGIAEEDSDCCVVGRTYVLMLRNVGQGLFASVNGRYGVFPADRMSVANSGF